MVNGIRLEITSEKMVWAQRRVIPTKGRFENVIAMHPLLESELVVGRKSKMMMML